MNQERLAGNWKQLRGEVRKRWGKLTDDDVDVVDGQLEKLVGRLQERYGLSKEKARAEVEEWDAESQTGRG